MTLLLFVGAASMLISLAAILGVNLFGAVGKLMEDALTPHFMQMHTGAVDQAELEDFAAGYEGVEQLQTARFLNMDGGQIIIAGNTLPGTVQDNGFCTQNSRFDFLLDLDHNRVQPADGEVYVPVYYSREGAVKPGDTALIGGIRFTVAGFVQDSQMNSALASSKRFVVSEADYARLKPQGKEEYLIEFRLKDLSGLGQFAAAYSAAGLPANGPALTWPLFRMISAMSDGILIALILLVGALVIFIALLCIRFTLLAKIEEDYQEIGTMKAIGMSGGEIRGLYLTTYGAITAAGSLLGFLVSLLLYGPMTENIRANLGDCGNDAVAFGIGAAGILLLDLFILLFVCGNLQRFRKISAAEAVRFGMSGGQADNVRPVPLAKGRGIPINFLLGLHDVRSGKKLYGTMLVVVTLAAFIIIVPQNLYHTISAEDFITYMGVGRCDMRVDIQQEGEAGEKAAEVASYMETDPDISRYTVLKAKTFGVRLDDSTMENIKIELGDHSVFPIHCSRGRMPLSEEEIALSSMNAEEWEKEVGDKITVLTDEGEQELEICGIYSDITNGGKTAKAVFDADSRETAWSIVCAAFTDPEQTGRKVEEYKKHFVPAKVSGIDSYVSQTFGQTLRSVRTASFLSAIVAAAVTMLVTLLFLRLLVAKERYSIAVMKAVGFTGRDVKMQYVWRAAAVLAAGIALGTLLAGTFGEKLAAAVLSSIGAEAFRFVGNLPAAWLFCPVILMLSAGIAVTAGTSAVENVSISQAIKE